MYHLKAAIMVKKTSVVGIRDCIDEGMYIPQCRSNVHVLNLVILLLTHVCSDSDCTYSCGASLPQLKQMMQ